MDIDLDASDFRDICRELDTPEVVIGCGEHLEAGVYATYSQPHNHVRFQCRECQRWLMNVAVAEPAS